MTTLDDGGPIAAIVLRLTGSADLDGVWMSIRPGAPPVQYLQYGNDVTTLVATGSIEWNGDNCAEVYVPEDQLAVWQAEHQV